MIIIGVDEAGRGPLVGSVIAAAVTFPENFYLEGLTDSKKLTEKKRENFYSQIIHKCNWSVGEASCIEIDQINILQATMLAMKRAINNLQLELSISYKDDQFKVLVDGNQCPDVSNCQAIVRGDLIEPVISAASVIAKVTRDRQMKELDLKNKLIKKLTSPPKTIGLDRISIVSIQDDIESWEVLYSYPLISKKSGNMNLGRPV